MFSRIFALFAFAPIGFMSGTAFGAPQASSQAGVISVPDQNLAVLENGFKVAEYPVSTSRYGLGDRFGSYATPLGRIVVVEKVGQSAPLGAVFKNRQRTGEVLNPKLALDQGELAQSSGRE
jgi:hypothetical protein